jgi:hypothetical protein
VKLTREQLEFKLPGLAAMGDEGAKHLLRLMFPDLPSKDSTDLFLLLATSAHLGTSL